jgi:hypothetical protein
MCPLSLLAEANLPSLEIPDSIRAIVYLVGMLGFPVVVTIFVLTRLADRLKNVDKSLLELSDRITERPMGLERTTDFVIYLCDALQAELRAGLRHFTFTEITTECAGPRREDIARCLSMIRRELAGYLRPIFRRHQRFASRFLTVGGNLGSMFTLAAPSEDIEAGQTEARLVGQTFKDPAEAALAVLMNNIHQFGHPWILKLHKKLGQEQLPPQIAALLQQAGDDSPPDHAQDEPDNDVQPTGPFEVIDRELFVQLSVDGLETITTILRDSMLEQVRANTSEYEGRADDAKVRSSL